MAPGLTGPVQVLYETADAALRPRVAPLLERAAVGVVGLGLEGASTCGHLLSTAEQIDLTVIDDDETAALRLPAARRPSQRLRFLSGAQVAGAAPGLDVVFKSPGVPPDHPAIPTLSRRCWRRRGTRCDASAPAPGS